MPYPRDIDAYPTQFFRMCSLFDATTKPLRVTYESLLEAKRERGMWYAWLKVLQRREEQLGKIPAMTEEYMRVRNLRAAATRRMVQLRSVSNPLLLEREIPSRGDPVTLAWVERSATESKAKLSEALQALEMEIASRDPAKRAADAAEVVDYSSLLPGD